MSDTLAQLKRRLNFIIDSCDALTKQAKPCTYRKVPGTDYCGHHVAVDPREQQFLLEVWTERMGLENYTDLVPSDK